jgi:zinc protease
VLPRHGLPLVAARAALVGGLLAERESTSGITAFLTSLWLRGTESFSAAEFANAVESRAGDIDSFAGRSSFGLTLEAPSAQWEPLLDLFAEVLLSPSLDPEEIERERRETLAAIARREDQLARRALLLFAETHFREHPYRLPSLGSAASVGALDRDALLAHHDALVTARNLVIAVAGDVDPDAVARGVASRFAELDGRPFEPPRPPREPAPREIRRAEIRKEREQAHCVIGVRGVDIHDPDRHALEVIAQLLAGQGGRLFLELRDRRGPRPGLVRGADRHGARAPRGRARGAAARARAPDREGAARGRGRAREPAPHRKLRDRSAAQRGARGAHRP